MQTKSDKLFTAWVNWIQGAIIPLGVKLRLNKRMHNVPPPTADLQARLIDLGINIEQIWWGPMTLFPRKVKFLLDTIEAEPPTAVLEIGSGTSTPILAALAYRYGFSVISVENHPGSIDYVKALLHSVPGGSSVQLELRGFVRRSYPDGKKYYWYDINLGDYGRSLDFVLIDGPMSSLVGRNGALPEVAPYLASNHRIYLDDASRHHERKCLREWKQYFPDLIVPDIQPCRGVAMMHLDGLSHRQIAG